ncbi:MAG: hypothetical protein ABJG78_11765 [Cyclobacteriaceae bacterium]
MKKILLRFTGLIVSLVALFLVFPELLFDSAWGQRFYLWTDGAQAANFSFKDGEVSGDTVFMNGDIYKGTLTDMEELLKAHPEITTLVMNYVPGSIDDEANLLASREIRKNKINTYVPEGGMIASGGTDMFLAGVKRNAHETAKIGVHSWGGGDKMATEYPREDEVHEIYLDYYEEMSIPLEFYWYTLEAASADSIHWMTVEEIKKYQVTNNDENER